MPTTVVGLAPKQPRSNKAHKSATPNVQTPTARNAHLSRFAASMGSKRAKASSSSALPCSSRSVFMLASMALVMGFGKVAARSTVSWPSLMSGSCFGGGAHATFVSRSWGKDR